MQKLSEQSTDCAIKDTEVVERDAARYRWLRDAHRLSEVFIGDRGDALNLDNTTPDEVDALIDEQIGLEGHAWEGLKPCPFCGHPTPEEVTLDSGAIAIACNRSCGATGPFLDPPYEDRDEAAAYA